VLYEASNRHVTAVKFVIAGGFGVGKTTFVGAISEVEPLTTEAAMTVVATGIDDHKAVSGTTKTTTTVAMDFGRLTVDETLVMYLFGAPGQGRFTFMWDDLINGALGAVVLVDTRRVEDCFPAVDFFEKKHLPFVVGVNLIIGLLRSVVNETREPGPVLTKLNSLLAGQMDGRFATCCCVLMSREGRVRMANAGHLSPYCGGREVETPGGLPLGVAPEVEYAEVSFSIPEGERLVMLSDGVVEARSKSGELYGFERTRSISIEPIHQIAAKAQQFGQEDDITVLGIELQPAFV
jgi:uncharacterized protein